jgi:type I site-specific restriction endonuclease
MSIHNETDADTRAERIDPVLAAAGWGQNGSKVRRDVWPYPDGQQSRNRTPSIPLQQAFTGKLT